jgi:hypothetical protein
MMVFEEPVKATVEEVAVKDDAEEVFHEPAMLTVADPNVMVAAPDEVRLELKVGVDEVSVRVPEKVRAPVKVVEIPELTVRLLTVWVMLMDPPEAFTTTEEVPTVYVPADVSMLVTVRVEPSAVRIPPTPTVRVTALTAKFEALVSKVVVEDPSEMVSAAPILRPRVAIVKVWAVAALDVKVRLLNSFTDRFAPAKVIVPPVAEVNVTVAVPGFQDAEVELFVHVPAIVHVSDPKAMYELADEMLTIPLMVTLPDVDVRAPPLIAREAADRV